jgi:capsular polysaccharide biosynthesis protein
VEQPRDLDFLGAMRRRWLLVAVLTVLGAVAGYGASRELPPVYEAKASLLVGDFENGDVSSNEIDAMQSLAATYADIARRAPVLSAAARDVGVTTGWSDLGKSVHIRVAEASPQVIEITVEGSSAAWATSVATAVSTNLTNYVDRSSGGVEFVSPQLRELERSIEQGQKKVDELLARQSALGDAARPALELKIERAQDQVSAWRSNYASFKQLSTSASHVSIRQLDPAAADPNPVSPNIRFNTVLAGFAGFLLAMALVFLLETRISRLRPEPEPEPEPPNGSSPLILPPGMSRVTVRANGREANGSDIRGATTPGRAAEHHEGDSR